MNPAAVQEMLHSDEKSFLSQDHARLGFFCPPVLYALPRGRVLSNTPYVLIPYPSFPEQRAVYTPLRADRLHDSLPVSSGI